MAKQGILFSKPRIITKELSRTFSEGTHKNPLLSDKTNQHKVTREEADYYDYIMAKDIERLFY